MFMPCASLPCAAVLAFPIALSAIGVSTPTLAHDALPTAAQPHGWAYPVACCSGFDCREVAEADIIEGPRGYVIKTTGEVIPMTDRKVRQSPDGQFHWCSLAGKADGKTICLFVPPRAY
jgi:hypothetical protein